MTYHCDVEITLTELKFAIFSESKMTYENNIQ